MISKFWIAPLVHNFHKFSSEKNKFFIWPGGGFPLFVCGISQKNSVDFRFLGMTSSLLYFLQSPKWTVSFFRVSSHFTTAVLVFLSMLITCPRWIQCFPWFSTQTWSPSQMHKASKLVDSFFLLPKKEIWFKMMLYCTSNCLLPVAIPHLILCHESDWNSHNEWDCSLEWLHICSNHLQSHTHLNYQKYQVFQCVL